LKVDDFHYAVSAEYEMVTFDPLMKPKPRQDVSEVAKGYVLV